MKSVLFYVSGHGYGHATRMGEVIRSLASMRPDWAVHVATSAPLSLFPRQTVKSLHFHKLKIDSGVIEKDSLTVDPQATLDQAETLFHDRHQLIDSEAAFVWERNIDFIVADIPYLAGYVAETAGVACLGISNFTWDWIYEPYCSGDPKSAYLLEWIRGGYTKMHSYLKLPFSHAVGVFGVVSEVPLVARCSSRERTDILRALLIDPEDRRPCVLLASRGVFPPSSLAAAAKAGKEFLFLHTEPQSGSHAENIRHVMPGTILSLPDLLSVSSVVVAKLGYGTLAEAIAAGTSVLYPPRTGFREDILLRVGASCYVRSAEIPLVDYWAGRWIPHLRELLTMSPPLVKLETNGSTICAEKIVHLVEE